MSTTRSRLELPSRAAALATSTTGFVSPKLAGRTDRDKGGRSVHAIEPVRRGELLVVWGGDIVTGAQLLQLPRDVRERLCLQIEEDLFLLTTREGPSDWVNHSCSPNSGLDGQIVLVSLRDIEPGEEIAFDYATCDASRYCEFDCRCGTADCRSRVTADDWRLPELQKRYRGHFSPYLARRIEGMDRRAQSDRVDRRE